MADVGKTEFVPFIPEYENRVLADALQSVTNAFGEALKRSWYLHERGVFAERFAMTTIADDFYRSIRSAPNLYKIYDDKMLKRGQNSEEELNQVLEKWDQIDSEGKRRVALEREIDKSRMRQAADYPSSSHDDGYEQPDLDQEHGFNIDGPNEIPANDSLIGLHDEDIQGLNSRPDFESFERRICSVLGEIIPDKNFACCPELIGLKEAAMICGRTLFAQNEKRLQDDTVRRVPERKAIERVKNKLTHGLSPETRLLLERHIEVITKIEWRANEFLGKYNSETRKSRNKGLDAWRLRLLDEAYAASQRKISRSEDLPDQSSTVEGLIPDIPFN